MPKTALTRAAYVSLLDGNLAHFTVEGVGAIAVRLTESEARKVRAGGTAPLRVRFEMVSEPPAIVSWVCVCGNERLAGPAGSVWCHCGREMRRR